MSRVKPAISRKDTQSAKADRVAELHAAGADVDAIAMDVGCHRHTVYGYLRTPAVRRRVSEIRGEQLAPVYKQLLDGATAAVGVMRQILEDPDATRRERLEAAGMFFDKLKLVSDQLEIGSRLAHLEELAVAHSGVEGEDPADDTVID